MDANDLSGTLIANHTAIMDGPNSQLARQRESCNISVASKDTMRTNKGHKRWNRRLKFFFCCLGYKKNKESFADVASIFANFFSDLDSSPAEIVAGFVALSKFQKAQREWNVNNGKNGVQQYLSNVPITPETRFLDVSEADDSHLMNELIYYMNYALAIFGWPLQMIDDPCMLCCIWPYMRISPCCRRGKMSNKLKENKGNTDRPTSPERQAKADGSPKEKSKSKNRNASPKRNKTKSKIDRGETKVGQLASDCDTPIIIDDNCCSCNSASIERRLAVHNYEIIYITYHVEVSRVPFLVAADHSRQTVVVAVRGSMSLEDIITDMNGQIDKLPIKNCPDDWLCHRGITRAADYVKTKLIDDGILDRAFNCRPDLGSQDYNLIVCGHSLGAGAAAILGILLRDRYPHLKAYVYSPPGGLLSMPVVEYTKQFTIGVILGNDCVPRLGVAQMERLRYQVYLSLRNTPQSPTKILAKHFCCACCCCKKEKLEYDPQVSSDLLDGANGQTFEYRGHKIPFQCQPQPLYVPGRILHIVKNRSLQSRATRLCRGPVYQAVWMDNTNYDRIVVANGMFCDHIPTNVMNAMKMVFVKTIPVRKNSKPKSPHWDANKTVNSPRDDNNNNDTENRNIAEKPNLLHDYQRDDNNNDAKIVEEKQDKHKHRKHVKARPQVDQNGNDGTTQNRNIAQPDYNEAHNKPEGGAGKRGSPSLKRAHHHS